MENHYSLFLMETLVFQARWLAGSNCKQLLEGNIFYDMGGFVSNKLGMMMIHERFPKLDVDKNGPPPRNHLEYFRDIVHHTK